jgi:GTP cyclohydrolase I
MAAILRDRLETLKLPFFANDNIHAVIQPGDLHNMKAEISRLMEEILQTLGIDTKNDHNSKGTADRVAKMFVDELYSGRFTPEPSSTEFPNYRDLNQFYIVGPIRMNSACSHHMLPIVGHAWVGVLPGKECSLLGLSKIPRIVEWFAQRPQIQEELVEQIANHIFAKVGPTSLAVTIKAAHYCMKMRGIKDPCCSMTTQAFRGEMLTQSDTKAEYNTLLLGHRFADPSL